MILARPSPGNQRTTRRADRRLKLIGRFDPSGEDVEVIVTICPQLAADRDQG